MNTSKHNIDALRDEVMFEAERIAESLLYSIMLNIEFVVEHDGAPGPIDQCAETVADMLNNNTAQELAIPDMTAFYNACKALNKALRDNQD